MLMSDYLQEKVNKYCELKNISYINGQVSAEHKNEIQSFIYTTLKRDRDKTRKIEQRDSSKTDVVLRKLLGSLSESPIEEYMVNAFFNADIAKYCVPQYQIGTKRVDFAFPKAMLVVECDGKEYHFTDQTQIERDQKRDIYLAKRGWRVIHFDGLIIRRNITVCIEKIKKYLRIFIKDIKCD